MADEAIRKEAILPPYYVHLMKGMVEFQQSFKGMEFTVDRE